MEHSATRVFMMVWDGMRPDLVSPELTPNLCNLADRGVRFDNNHAVFPTVTRINSATLATGVLPIRHGIVGNSLYAPKVDALDSVSIGDHRTIFKLIDSRGGRLVPFDTLADRVHAAGGRTVVVSTGSPGSAFLCHPRVRECPGDRLFNQAFMLPDGALAEFEAWGGAMPGKSIPNTRQDAHFTQAIVDYVLPKLDPTLLVFWHTDPDSTTHATGFGSPEALESIRDADTNLGAVLEGYRRRGLLDDTLVVVASDHGYATIDPLSDLHAPLKAGSLLNDVAERRLIVSTNGFTTFFNVSNGDPGLIARLAEALMDWDHGGCVFTGSHGRPVIPGTLPLRDVGLGGELAPDVACAMAWDDRPNAHGFRGTSAGVDGKNLATHGGISPWEIRNTLVMAGPRLCDGLVSTTPSGNVDVAPTLFHLLGLDGGGSTDGRVLVEALANGPSPATIGAREETLTAERGRYRQMVRFSIVAETRYLDYGKAERG